MDIPAPQPWQLAPKEAARALAGETEPEGVLAKGVELLLASGAPWAGAWIVPEAANWLRRVAGHGAPSELDWLARAALDGVAAHEAADVGLGAWARRLGAQRVVVASCGAAAHRRGVIACLEAGPPDASRLELVALLAELLGGYCAALEVRRAAEAERARLAERLLHLQRLEGIGLCASGVAHDFNNLLAVVVGNASLAMQRLAEDSPERRLLRDAIGAAQRGEDLSHQLLSLTGDASFRCDTLDLAAEVGAVGPLLRTVLSRKLRLVCELDPAWVEADVGQVRQVTLNLVANAAEAMGERGGAVVIRTGTTRLDASAVDAELGPGRAAGRYAWLEVQDDGPGLEPDVRAHLFEPFFTTKGLGRGLGLSAVREIARYHDAVVRVDSEPGRGARFRVWFPGAPVADEGLGQDSEEEVHGAGLVLVVEDLPDVRATARLMLEHLGYTVAEAGDGAEALRRVEELGDALSAILLDLWMPVMDGEEFLDALRQQARQVPVVLYSGLNQSDEIKRITSGGATVFLQKPFTVQQLGRSLAQVMADQPP